jgi:hypothetical protein
LRYAGDAALYTTLRISMMAVGWLIAAFFSFSFLLILLKIGKASESELFAFSLILSFCFLGAFYGITYHEPALRFYRSLAAAMPFGIKYMADKIIVRNFFRKTIPALLLAASFIFLILSPTTKWGWAFIGYPTEPDVALCNYITWRYGSLPNSILYAPGSHYLLGFFSFKVKEMETGISIPTVYLLPYDVEFDIDKAMKANYTAPFYRIFIFPRWFGKDITASMKELEVFRTNNNIIYSNADFWFLIEHS